MPYPLILPAALEALINPLLKQLCRSPVAAADLARLQGQCLAIHLAGRQWSLYAHFDEGGVLLSRQTEVPVAAWVEAPLSAYLDWLKDPQIQRLRAHPQIQLGGDTQLWEAVQGLLTAGEGQLAAAIGGLAVSHPLASGVVSQLGQGLSWLQQLGRNLLQETQEYVTEEAAWLPSVSAWQALQDQQEALRTEVDRVEARIRRLEAKTDLGNNA